MLLQSVLRFLCFMERGKGIVSCSAQTVNLSAADSTLFGWHCAHTRSCGPGWIFVDKTSLAQNTSLPECPEDGQPVPRVFTKHEFIRASSFFCPWHSNMYWAQAATTYPMLRVIACSSATYVMWIPTESIISCPVPVVCLGRWWIKSLATFLTTLAIRTFVRSLSSRVILRSMESSCHAASIVATLRQSKRKCRQFRFQ